MTHPARRFVSCSATILFSLCGAGLSFTANAAEDYSYLGRNTLTKPKVLLESFGHHRTTQLAGRTFDFTYPKADIHFGVRFDKEEFEWWDKEAKERKVTREPYIAFELRPNLYFVTWSEQYDFSRGMVEIAYILDLEKMTVTDSYLKDDYLWNSDKKKTYDWQWHVVQGRVKEVTK